MIRFGPAGWDYKDWAGIVYPKPRPRGFDPLVHLARYFDTVEVNSTFYRPMAGDVAAGWAERAGTANSHFRFTLKLWRRFTHERKEAWSAKDVKEARRAPEALMQAGRLGALLVQFPWSFRNEERNAAWLHDVLSAFDGFPRVVEVRHASWNTSEFYGSLLERGVGIVNIDQPLFKSSIKPEARVTSPTGYVRVHGRNYKDWFRKDAGRDARYDYLYSAKELAGWAKRIETLDAHPVTEDVYAVTNNHYLGKAPTNALMLQALVEEKRVEAPETLRRAYPEALGPYVRKPAAAETARHSPPAVGG